MGYCTRKFSYKNSLFFSFSDLITFIFVQGNIAHDLGYFCIRIRSETALETDRFQTHRLRVYTHGASASPAAANAGQWGYW